MNPQLIEARELIKAKQYDEARRILKKIDHPTAKNWLETLDTIAPEKSAKAKSAAKATSMPDKSPNLAKTKSPALSSPTTKPAEPAASRFPEGKDKVQMLKAGELIKAAKFAEARRILEKIDHPKAREWLQQIEKRTNPIVPNSISTSMVAAEPLTAASVDGVSLRKPLPGVEFGDTGRKAKPNSNYNLIILGAAVVLFVLGLVGLSTIATTTYGSLQVIAIGVPLLLMGLGAAGGMWVFRDFFGPWMMTRLGIRIVLLIIVVVGGSVVTLVNSIRRIPFEDAALTMQYPAIWQTKDMSDYEDCLDDPDNRRCMLVLWNGNYGNTIWFALKEEVSDFDTTVADEDAYLWSWETENRSGTLINRWDVMVDGQPGILREYSIITDEGDIWYRLNLFVMRDARHLIRLSFDSRTQAALERAMGDFETIYNSIDLAY